MARVTRAALNMLPHSSEAEEAVIGSLLIDPDAVWRVSETGLQAADFYGEAWGRVFEALMGLAVRSQPITDLVLVTDALAAITTPEGASLLDLVGGSSELTRLITATPTAIYAAHYAKVVRDYALRRRVVALGADLASLGHAHDGEVDELRNEVMQRTLALVNTGQTEDTHLYGGYDYLAHQEDRKQRLAADPDAFIRTGLPRLDTLLGDMQPGTVNAVVARASVGKTMMLEQMAEHNARKGKRVAFYHLELTHEYMIDRRMARYSHVAMNELRRAYVGQEVQRAARQIAQWEQNLIYVYCPGWTAERIALDIGRLAARDECDLVLVDYLQLLALPEENRFSRNSAQVLGDMIRTLKTACAHAGAPLVLGAQVSRGYRENKDRRPLLENIRDTGQLEEFANQIIILHPEKPREEREQHAQTELIECNLAKNTGGATGLVHLVHILGRFALGEASDADERDLAEEREAQEEIAPFF